MILKLARFVTLWLLQAGLLVADKKVPGDNPLSFCSENPAEDVLHIDEVTLIPDPPVRGQGLKIKAQGHLTQTLKEGGGALRFTSWSGGELVDDESLELCEGLGMFGQECPIDAGHLSVSEDIILDEEDIPKGTFYAQVNVTMTDGRPITCFGGEFTF